MLGGMEGGPGNKECASEAGVVSCTGLVVRKSIKMLVYQRHKHSAIAPLVPSHFLHRPLWGNPFLTGKLVPASADG